MRRFILCSVCFLLTHLLAAQQFQDLPDTIWVAVSANDAHIRPEIEDMLKTSAQAMLLKANLRQKQPVKFIMTDDLEYADVHYKLLDYRLVTAKEKTTAFLLTVAGVALPVALAASGVPFTLVFYFTPQNKYITAVEYSPYFKDLGFTDNLELLSKVRTGYAASDQKNEGKIAAHFGQQLAHISKNWNKQHRKALKMKARASR